jgi:hypothetical protein
MLKLRNSRDVDEELVPEQTAYRRVGRWVARLVEKGREQR